MHRTNTLVLSLLVAFVAFSRGYTGDSIFDGNPGTDYGLVIDAGSTHSSLFIFSWPTRRSRNTTAPVTKPNQLGVSPTSYPGVSNCCQNQNEMDNYLSPLIQYAYDYLSDCNDDNSPCLSDDQINLVPLYLKATAGMRILHDSQRVTILSWIRDSLLSNSVNPWFYFESGWALIISGEEEAFFGWLSVNLLTNLLKSSNSNSNNEKESSVSDAYPSVGSLDLGGQSSQIAFEVDPSGNVLEEFSAVHLWGYTHRLFTHSFLTYGMEGFESKMAQLSYDTRNDWNDSDNGMMIVNPCLFQGYSQGYNVTMDDDDDGGLSTTLLVNETGQSDSGMCPHFVKRLFYNDTQCLTGQCSIVGVYQPMIPENMTFYAFSGYSYVIEELGLSENQSPLNISNLASDICSMDFNEFMNSSYGQSMVDSGNEQYCYEVCLQLTYMSELLIAYGFAPDSTQIVFSNDIDGSELGWALGSMLRDVNWMEYDLIDDEQKHSDHNNGLNGEGKAYRDATFSLLALVLAGSVCLCLVFCKRKYEERVTGYTRFHV